MRYAFLSAVVLSLSSLAVAGDWLTLPSTYSHDPATGQRVTQFAPIDAPTAPSVTNFRTSGYTHTRSSLNYGQSMDNYHRVEQWGEPVRPYGEWRFPFRPYGTPYPNWGAPFAGLNTGFGNRFNGVGGGFGPGYSNRPDHGGEHKPGDKKPGLPRKHSSDERGFLGDGRWPSDRDQKFSAPQGPLNPYPAGAGSPYPVAPYYDGYYPPYRD